MCFRFCCILQHFGYLNSFLGVTAIFDTVNKQPLTYWFSALTIIRPCLKNVYLLYQPCFDHSKIVMCYFSHVR